MALVLRILDEIPRSPIRRPVTWYVFSKRPQLSVSTDEPRRALARTPPPAFLFPDQRFQRPEPVEPAELFSAGSRRRRLSSRPSFSCQAVLFKELSFHETAPEGAAEAAI